MWRPRSSRHGDALLLAAAITLGVVVRLERALRHPDFFEDGHHHWWMAARLATTGEYGDPFARHAMGIWLPGYDMVAAVLLLSRGAHDVLALRVLSIALAAVSTWLVWRLARRIAPGAAAPAAFLFALHPFDVLTSAMPLPEPLAIALVLAAANALLAPPTRSPAWAWAGAALIATAAVVRYEAWVMALLLAATLARVERRREAALCAASVAGVALVWTTWSAASGNAFFLARILEQLGGETRFHIRAGFVPATVLGRLASFASLYVPPLTLILAPALAQTWRQPRAPLVPLAWGLPVVVALLVVLGISAGSPRYAALAAPFLAILAGSAWRDLARAAARRRAVGGAVVMALLVLGSAAAAGGLGAFVDGAANVHGAKMRAGAWLAQNAPPERVIVAESPMAAWRSGHDPALLVGSKHLPETRDEALAYLRAHVSFVVYVNNSPEKYPFYRLNVLFPELSSGRDVEGFRLAFDPDNWEKAYGGQEVYVYSVEAAR